MKRNEKKEVFKDTPMLIDYLVKEKGLTRKFARKVARQRARKLISRD